MIRPLALFASLALLPATLGPLPAEARNVYAVLCGGGELAIPVGGDSFPGSRQDPCCAKGCHAGGCRKRVDKSQ